MDQCGATAPSGMNFDTTRSNSERWLRGSIDSDTSGCFHTPMDPYFRSMDSAAFHEHYEFTDIHLNDAMVRSFPASLGDTTLRQGHFMPTDQPWPRVVGSPDDIGQSSPYSGSSFDEVISPPYPTPLLSDFDYPIHCAGNGTFSLETEGVHLQTCAGDASFVAPYDVQIDVDEHQGETTFEDEQAGYSLPSYVQLAHEGYQPVEVNNDIKEEPLTPALTADQASPGPSDRSHASPNLRRRRLATEPSRDRPATESKVTKRSAAGRKTSPAQHSCHRSSSDAIRPFACPFAVYGCTTSFGAKNEWKRHIKIQHLRLSFWRCDQCNDNELPNDFNRKDLFTSHMRRMHTTDVRRRPKNRQVRKSEQEEEFLNQAAKRCFITVRVPPPRTLCLFCDVEFDTSVVWNDRLEHIGRHMEAMKKGEEKFVPHTQWNVDEDMHGWLVRERLIKPDEKDGWTLA